VDVSVLLPAMPMDGKLRMWATNYRALVDAQGNSTVRKNAYHVLSKEYEDALRMYETDRYEVVRRSILVGRREAVLGLTTRFFGEID
jgi:hypothetical protein